MPATIDRSLRDRSSGRQSSQAGSRLCAQSYGSGPSEFRQSGSTQVTGSERSSSCRFRRDCRSRSPSTSATTYRGSAGTELRGLFNWTTPASGRGGKRKGSIPSGRPKSKKTKVVTWTHTWVCLSGTRDDMVPDAFD